jgi:hypothetical protein
MKSMITNNDNINSEFHFFYEISKKIALSSYVNHIILYSYTLNMFQLLL